MMAHASIFDRGEADGCTLRVCLGHAAEERMQKLFQRTMWHLLRVDGQLAPELQAKITVVEVISTCNDCRSQNLQQHI